MSLEDAIRGNTEAILALTELFIKGAKLPLPVEMQSCMLPAAPVGITKSYSISYSVVKDLILNLSDKYRNEIRTILTRHGLKKLSDLLKDADKPEDGVLNESKLFSLYDELSKLGEEQ